VKPVVAVAPAPMTGELAINSVPAGAQVQIDGRSDPGWVTPYAVTLYAGTHSIVVIKPGFSTQSQNVEVVASNRAAVSLNLSEMAAIAAVNSDPAGSSIYVDGRDSGKVTPAQLSLNKGSHTITVKRLGYFEASQSVDLNPGQTAHFSPSLKAMGDANEVRSTNKLGKLFGGGVKDVGVVKIKTAPKGAQITINNRMMDRGTPAEFAIPPGNYQIVLTAPGYKPLQKMITLQSGDRLNLDEVLEK
jgi:PEGA domain